MEAIAIVHFVNYPKGQDRPCMAGVMRYTAQEEKTMWEDRHLVSGFNCCPESVYDDFLSTKLLHRKEGGTLFYHLVQSFPAGERVDPAAAHAAALKLAEYFQGREVLVCTHTDRDHIHSHLIINSVSLEDGKKLHIGKRELEELRRRNDEVCAALDLPVFQPNPERKPPPMPDTEYRSAARGESWKFQTMNAIDWCMRRTASREEFVRAMERLGYGIRWEPGRQNITYTHPNGKRVRDRKLHEEKYLKERMEREFAIRQQIISGGIEAAQRAAARASDSADRANTDPSHGRGMAGTAGNSVGPGRVAGDTGHCPGGTVPPPADLAVFRADAGRGQGSGGNSETAGAGAAEAGTSWEEERAAFFASLAQPSTGPVRAGVAVPAAGTGLAVGGAMLCAAALDEWRGAYVTRPRSESKALRREREKKIAAGHKADDREENQGPNLAL
ncbi:MAG: relaxase/mobilization nuclease domain-containing protein [Oscillospiraceae bacterium]|nr:relaxase/mobilization nuclease domain-containing protein [Oscillospiraceae bacterium]